MAQKLVSRRIKLYEIVDFENKEKLKEYTTFLEEHDRCNFQQSVEWGNVKESWKKYVVLSKTEDGTIQGAQMIWVRNIPIFGNMMYAPRGPICDIHNEDVLEDLTNGANELAKQNKAFVYRCEPEVEKGDESYREIMLKLGYEIKDDSKDFKEEIQPRCVFKLDIKGKTKDQLFEKFHTKTRYNIRLATKKGVQIKEGTREDLEPFHKIMIETGKRDGFVTRSLEYFQKMWDELVPTGHMKLLMAYTEDGTPIAGIIPIIYGRKVWYLYGASSNQYRNIMPNYLLQWTMIQEAVDRKADVYDFRGVPSNTDPEHPNGLYRFKKGFNADYIEFIGEVFIPYRPAVYNMYKLSEKGFRVVRKIKRGIK